MKNEIYIYPTDTVWGIGASIDSASSQKRIRQIKGSSPDKPMSILFSDVDDVFATLDKKTCAGISEDFFKKLFSLESTLLLPVNVFKTTWPSYLIGASSYVGIRCLQGDFLKRLTAKCGGPITTTSLNTSGRPPILSQEDALDFANLYCPDAIVEYKGSLPCSGHSSTIYQLDLNGGKLRKAQIIRGGRFAAEIKDLFISEGLNFLPEDK